MRREVAALIQDLELDRMSTAELLPVLVALMIVGILLGLVADVVMGRRGLGILGNGILIDLGIYGALHVLSRHVGGLRITDPFVLLFALLGGATLALLFGGLLKRLIWQ